MKVVRYSVPVSADSIVIEEDRLPYFYEYLHYHNDMQLTVILKGEGTLIVDHYKQRFTPGEIYFINARNPHLFCSDVSYFDHQKENSAHAIHIYFDEKKLIPDNYLPEMNNIRRLLNIVKHGIQIPNKNEAYVKRQVIRIKNSSGFERLYRFVRLLHYFTGELHEVRDLSSGVKNHLRTVSENPRIKEVYQFTLKHYNTPISLETVSQICSMTQPAFCKFFKKHTSKTYMNFLHEIRVSKACNKIIQGDFENMTSLAYSCGFNSTVNFNKVFKKVVKVSPSDYIRKHRNQKSYA
ncbi:AraC family transcriptional regulator [Sinomicrobium soli]|uniref:AraC family transcriptional regulator n=1 Tax=Sinomicrobium sp. N-1-3-6 TaxID=2219864 RepID=UPI000DCBE082|nr:AraC family transcriptional regulator [Sinomicrobium sp. N-1-3-6]RAV28069.1 hypothetical protein DN748_15325 [Sinomicrobium sp. N-1-3-6]